MSVLKHLKETTTTLFNSSLFNRSFKYFLSHQVVNMIARFCMHFGWPPQNGFFFWKRSRIIKEQLELDLELSKKPLE